MAVLFMEEGTPEETARKAPKLTLCVQRRGQVSAPEPGRPVQSVPTLQKGQELSGRPAGRDDQGFPGP